MAKPKAKPRRHKPEPAEPIQRDAEYFLAEVQRFWRALEGNAKIDRDAKVYLAEFRKSDSKRGALAAVMAMLAALTPKEADDLANFLLASCGEAFHPIGRPVGNFVRTLLRRHADRPDSATTFLAKWATSRIGNLEGNLYHGRSPDDEVTAKMNAVADIVKREGISEAAACRRLMKEHDGQADWIGFDDKWYRRTKSNRKRSKSPRR